MILSMGCREAEGLQREIEAILEGNAKDAVGTMEEGINSALLFHCRQ